MYTLGLVKLSFSFTTAWESPTLTVARAQSSVAVSSTDKVMMQKSSAFRWAFGRLCGAFPKQCLVGAFNPTGKIGVLEGPSSSPSQG